MKKCNYCNSSLSKWARGDTKFCSRLCADNNKKLRSSLKAIELASQLSEKECAQCLKKLFKNKENNKFCSSSCSAIYSNSRRSAEFYKSLGPAISKATKGKPKKNPHTLVYRNHCTYCHKIFYWKSIRKSCSRACLLETYRLSGKKSAKTRNLRSRDEIKLFDLCCEHFECIANHVVSDGRDADIVILELKIAIMWNGPWHYRSMPHKGHSLKQVQNRDKIKQKLFASLGWIVLVYEDRFYTPEQALCHILSVVREVDRTNIYCS